MKPAFAISNERSDDCCARRRRNSPPVNARRRSSSKRPNVREWLGRPHFYFESADRTSVPGVATGLAVTGAGGDVLFVEASVAEGPEGLTLTGQLGDVMKESAEIAMSYVRSHAKELDIDPRAVRRQALPLPRAGGRRPQGRPFGGRHDDDGARQSAARRTGAFDGRHDR